MVGDGARLLIAPRARRGAESRPNLDEAPETLSGGLRSASLRHDRALRRHRRSVSTPCRDASRWRCSPTSRWRRRCGCSTTSGSRRTSLAVIGGDGAYARKPSPAGLNALMAGPAADPASTVFVGDSTVDLETSRNAGVRAAIARYRRIGCAGRGVAGLIHSFASTSRPRSSVEIVRRYAIHATEHVTGPRITAGQRPATSTRRASRS